jgi:hypothetical protein
MSINFSDTTPTAPGGNVNVKWQTDVSGNVSAYAGIPGVSGSPAAVGIVIDGGGSTPATGSKGFVQVPYGCTITGWTILTDVSGSAQITVKKSTYAGFPTTASIVASAPPVLTSAQKMTSTALTGWTTAISSGDVLEFNLDSVTAISRIFLELQVTKS